MKEEEFLKVLYFSFTGSLFHLTSLRLSAITYIDNMSGEVPLILVNIQYSVHKFRVRLFY